MLLVTKYSKHDYVMDAFMKTDLSLRESILTSLEALTII